MTDEYPEHTAYDGLTKSECFVCNGISGFPCPENNVYWRPVDSTGWWYCKNDCCNVLKFNRSVQRAYVALTTYRNKNQIGLVSVMELQTRLEDGGSE
jgi:hypothetical protein